MLFEPLDLSELRLTEMQNFGEHIKQVLANTPYGIQAWKEGISTDSTEVPKRGIELARIALYKLTHDNDGNNKAILNSHIGVYTTCPLEDINTYNDVQKRRVIIPKGSLNNKRLERKIRNYRFDQGY